MIGQQQIEGTGVGGPQANLIWQISYSKCCVITVSAQKYLISLFLKRIHSILKMMYKEAQENHYFCVRILVWLVKKHVKLTQVARDRLFLALTV